SPRIRRPRVPCSRNTRFQLSSSCAGTWLSRDTPSSASPRSRRSTNSVFRAALQRSGSSTPSTADGSLLALAFPFFALIVDLLGSCHRSRDTVQRDRVRFTLRQGFIALTTVCGIFGNKCRRGRFDFLEQHIRLSRTPYVSSRGRWTRTLRLSLPLV